MERIAEVSFFVNYFTSNGFPGINACEKENGGCEDTCISTGPDTRKCECTDLHSFLKDDNKTCGCLPGWEEIGVNCQGVCACVCQN